MGISSIPKLKLFPLYPGGPVRETSGFGSTSFRTDATLFSTSYGVNTPSARSPLESGHYFSLQPDGSLKQNRVDDIAPFDQNLEIANNSTGRLQGASSSLIPDIPSKYQDIISHYAVSEANYDQLMAQPSFELSNLGLGLRVTPDGQGGVADISIHPSAASLEAGLSPGGPIGGPNQAKISAGAVYRVDPSTIPIGSGVSKAVKTVQTLLPNALQASANLNALTKPGNLGANLGNPTLIANANPLAARLAQLTPPEPGLALTGMNAQLNPAQVRSFAAVNAGLDVATTERFQQNMAALASGAQLQENYGAMHRITSIDRLMDGRIALTPPSNAPFSKNPGMSGHPATDAASDILDAASRRSSGGYLSNPFAGSSQADNGGSFSSQGDASTGFGSRSEGFSSQSEGGGQDTGRQGGFKRQPRSFVA